MSNQFKAESEHVFEVSSTSSPHGPFVHWRQIWRATNHLFERCGCHERLGAFSCCSLQRSFSLRAGRTAPLCLGNWKGFRHILEADPEPSLKQLAQTVTGQVGGLSHRSSPTGWKQAQGSVGNMQAALHAQIRTLIADVQSRYGDVETSVHSPLYPWTLRHAEWLSNRYLQKSDRLTAYTSEDGTKNAMVPFATLVRR